MGGLVKPKPTEASTLKAYKAAVKRYARAVRNEAKVKTVHQEAMCELGDARVSRDEAASAFERIVSDKG